MTTATSAGRRSPATEALPHLQVLADHVGRGGSTVTAPPSGPSRAGHLRQSGLELLALAATTVTDRLEHRLGDGIVAWREGAFVWLRLPGDGLPVAGLRVVLETRGDRDALLGIPPAADPGTVRFVWTSVDDLAGEVAARAFPDTGGEDDLAGFQGAVALARRLRRPLLIRLGTGSVIATRPAPRGAVEIGGRVGAPGRLPVSAPSSAT